MVWRVRLFVALQPHGLFVFFPTKQPIVEISPPPRPPFPRPSPQGTPEARPSPILRCLSRPRGAALCLAPGRSGGAATLPWARGAAGEGRWGECCRGGGTKGRLYFLSVSVRRCRSAPRLVGLVGPAAGLRARWPTTRRGQPLLCLSTTIFSSSCPSPFLPSNR